MTFSKAIGSLKSSTLYSWKSTGRLQQTVAGSIELTGKTLHSGKLSTVRIHPAFAGEGRYFHFKSKLIPASIDFAQVSPLCTTLCRDGYRVRTVEHLLSAMEAVGVDNCRIEIENSDDDDGDGCEVEVPILDGSAREWMEGIEQTGLKVATDHCGNNSEKVALYVNEPVHFRKGDAFVAAFPLPEVRTTYGIDFPQVADIGCQWFSSTPLHDTVYAREIASSRTFCVFEEVEKMRSAGLIKGGSLENAIVCSANKGWLNPPLRFHDEPCRHKVLDLIGDLSLLSRSGSQGIPVAHIISYKGGHALHAEFARHIKEGFD